MMDVITQPATPQKSPRESHENSAVMKVLNSLTGGACLGWIVANGVGIQAHADRHCMALGAGLALAFTLWTWKR